MNHRYALICSLATFVIMFDHLKLVAALPTYEGGSAKNSITLESKNSDHRDKSKMNQLLNCLVGNGTCTEREEEFKLLMSKVFKTQCAECTEEERKYVGHVFSNILLNYREYWNFILDIYDVDDTFRKNHEIKDGEEDASDGN